MIQNQHPVNGYSTYKSILSTTTNPLLASPTNIHPISNGIRIIDMSLSPDNRMSNISYDTDSGSYVSASSFPTEGFNSDDMMANIMDNKRNSYPIKR